MKPLLYVLHSGQLYGTERVALATLKGLRDDYEPMLLAPPGLALKEAQRHGFTTYSFSSSAELSAHLRIILAKYEQLVFMATGITHSLILSVLNLWYRRDVLHLHVVPGGTDERQSYGRKRYLNNLGIVFVTNSSFTKTRLIANGVRADRIKVIENFLYEENDPPTREIFTQQGVQRVVVVSRADPIKRLDLLLDALDRTPELGKLAIRVCGSGEDLYKLRQRAQTSHPNVNFLGFTDDVPAELAAADLLVHLCPVEPFGMAIIEAMAAGLPVLVPDTGGASTLVEEGSGFHFRANDADDLAKHLLYLTKASPEQLNSVVAGGRRALATRFSYARGIAEYRSLLGATKTYLDTASIAEITN